MHRHYKVMQVSRIKLAVVIISIILIISYSGAVQYVEMQGVHDYDADEVEEEAEYVQYMHKDNDHRYTDTNIGTDLHHDMIPGGEIFQWIQENGRDITVDELYSVLYLDPLEEFELKIDGDEDSNSGWNITTLDLNGDGQEDVVIGGPSDNNDEGVVYIYFGSGIDPGTPDLGPGDADVTISGEDAGDKFGWSVANAGDWSGNEISDLVIGAPGGEIVYVFQGREDWDGAYSADDAEWTLESEEEGDEFGFAVGGGADLTDNGRPDIFVGAPGAENDKGQVYVYEGFEDVGEGETLSYEVYGPVEPHEEEDEISTDSSLTGIQTDSPSLLDYGDPPPNHRPPSQRERADEILIRWDWDHEDYHTDIAVAISEEDEAIAQIIAEDQGEADDIEDALITAGADMANVEFTVMGDDTPTVHWIRDYGPMPIVHQDTGEVSFINVNYAWDEADRPEENQFVHNYADVIGVDVYDMEEDGDITLDGGHKFVEGSGIFYTTDDVYNQNDHLSGEEVEEWFTEWFNLVERDEGFETVAGDYGLAHLDMQVNILDETTVLVAEVDNYEEYPDEAELLDNTADFFENEVTARSGEPFEVERLPMHVYDTGPPTPSNRYLTYANSLIVNDIVLVPQYSDHDDVTEDMDQDAIEVYETALPDHTVIGIDAVDVADEGGAIHCTTREIPAENAPPTIDITSIYAVANEEVIVEAEITTDAPMDTAHVYYDTNGADDFAKVEMDDVGGDTYEANLGSYDDGTELNYFIRVEDDYNAVTYNGDAWDPHTDVIESIVETKPATDTTRNSAVLHGELTELEGYDEADVYFEYRIEGDEEWETTTPPQTYNEIGDFSEEITGLAETTTYEYRAIAEAEDGGEVTTHEGDILKFFTADWSRVKPDQLTDSSWLGEHTEIENLVEDEDGLRLCDEYDPVDLEDYCEVEGGDTSFGEYITNVQFNGIDRDSGDDGGYADHTDSISDPVVPGETYELSVTMETDNDNWITVVFDWSGDGDLTNEDVIEVGGGTDDTITVTTYITVPEDAAPGESILMRVMQEYGDYHTDPCGNQDYGETEDYTVAIAVSEGHRISTSYELDIEEVEESHISWESEEPGDTDLTIFTAVTETDSEPGSWDEATDGAQIPSITEGDDLTGRYLWFRYKLEGDGTETPVLEELTAYINGDPAIEIDSWTELDKLAGEDPEHPLDGNYVLVNDLTRHDEDYEGIGDDFDGIGYWDANQETWVSFTGTFDGQGHRIEGLEITSFDLAGMFREVDGAEINDLGLEDADVEATRYYAGGLIGRAYDSHIENCYVTGTIAASEHEDDSYAGGLIGILDGGSVTDSYSTADVYGEGDHVGGLIGSNDGEVTQSYATGEVEGDRSRIGGLIGTNLGTVSQSYATGDVYTDHQFSNAGGLIGRTDGDVDNSYSTGDVIADEVNRVGGFIGRVADSATVTNSYSTGEVSYVTLYEDAGGFVGTQEGELNDCFWDTDTSNIGEGDGVGSGDDDGVSGESTTAMHDIDTFDTAGWDIETIVNWDDEIWNINDGLDYPRLHEQAKFAIVEESGSVDPETIEAGDEVTIEVEVENIGHATDSAYVALQDNGVPWIIEYTDDLEPGGSETVTFTNSEEEAGTYDFYVGVEWYDLAGAWDDTWHSSFEVESSDADDFSVTIEDITAGNSPFIQIQDAEDEYGNDLEGEYDVDITIDGTTEDPTLTFSEGEADYDWPETITEEDTYTAEVTIDGVERSDEFYVEPSDVDYVLIYPDEDITITAGQSVDFNAEAYDEHHNLITDVDSEFDWYAEGGSITNTGNFEETQKGDYQVTATYEGTESDPTTVTVETAEVDDFSVTVSDITAGENPVIQIDNAVDLYGNLVDGDYEADVTIDETTYNPTLTFSEGEADYGWPEEMTDEGTYTAEVTIDHTTETDDFYVEPSDPDYIEIEPQDSTVVPGQDQSYTATAYDVYGNEIGDVTEETDWSIEEGAGGQWDQETGTYTSENEGVWTVTGEYEIDEETTLDDTATLNVEAVQEEEPDLIIRGKHEGDRFGHSLAGIRAVSEEEGGWTDLIVGAPYAPDEKNTGRAYIFYGSDGHPEIIDLSEQNADVTLVGEEEDDRFGWSVFSAGDVDGSGYGDVVVGAPGHGDEDGRAYVYFGNEDMGDGGLDAEESTAQIQSEDDSIDDDSEGEETIEQDENSLSTDEENTNHSSSSKETTNPVEGENSKSSIETDDDSMYGNNSLTTFDPPQTLSDPEDYWRWLYDDEWRGDADDGVGLTAEGVWYGGMVLDLSDDIGSSIMKVSYLDYDDDAYYVQAHVAEDDNGAPGEWLSSTDEYTPTGDGWVELDLEESVLIEEPGDYWVVLEVHDMGDNHFPIGVNLPYVDDGGYVNMFDDPNDPADWDTLLEHGLDYSWLLEAKVVTVETNPPTDTTLTSTELNGYLDIPEDDSADVHFRYREYGETEWDETDSQTIEYGAFSESITDLETLQKYEFKAVAEIDGTEAVGNTRVFIPAYVTRTEQVDEEWNDHHSIDDLEAEYDDLVLGGGDEGDTEVYDEPGDSITMDVSEIDIIKVKMWGAGGGGGWHGSGGSGGYIEVILDVSEFDELEIWVGGAGEYAGGSPGPGGWGRYEGGDGADWAGGGGGSTEIWADYDHETNDGTFLVAADAGGGGAEYANGFTNSLGGGGGARGGEGGDGDQDSGEDAGGEGFGGDGGDGFFGAEDGGDGGQQIDSDYSIGDLTEIQGAGSSGGGPGEDGSDGLVEITEYYPYEEEGERISEPLALDGIVSAGDTVIDWDAEEPDDTEVNIYTAITEDDQNAPEDWDEATNGYPIPSIEEGEDLSGHYLWIKQELSTEDDTVTPRLHDLTAALILTEGYWVGDIDTDWEERENWGHGYVPDDEVDVIIPDERDFYPLIQDNDLGIGTGMYYHECASMEIQDGGTVTFDGENLGIWVHGDLVIEGVLNHQAGEYSNKFYIGEGGNAQVNDGGILNVGSDEIDGDEPGGTISEDNDIFIHDGQLQINDGGKVFIQDQLQVGDGDVHSPTLNMNGGELWIKYHGDGDGLSGFDVRSEGELDITGGDIYVSGQAQNGANMIYWDDEADVSISDNTIHLIEPMGDGSLMDSNLDFRGHAIYDLVIDRDEVDTLFETSVTMKNDLIIDSGDVYMNGAMILSVHNYLNIQTDGMLTVQEDQTIDFSSSGPSEPSIDVVGDLILSGSEGEPATITSDSESRVSWDISGTFDADHYKIEYPDENGVSFSGEPDVVSLDNGHFDYPAPGGVLLDLSGVDVLPDDHIEGCTFDNSGDSSDVKNVRADIDTQNVQFREYSGDLASTPEIAFNHDDDPDDKIYWGVYVTVQTGGGYLDSEHHTDLSWQSIGDDHHIEVFHDGIELIEEWMDYDSVMIVSSPIDVAEDPREVEYVCDDDVYSIPGDTQILDHTFLFHAEFPPDVTIEGPEEEAQFGWSVSGGQDIFGSGKDDVIIGAPEYSDERGIVYLFLGDESGGEWEIGTTITTDDSEWSQIGENYGDNFGWSVHAAGDITGDNVPNFMTGAPYYSNTGRTYIFAIGEEPTVLLEFYLDGEEPEKFGEKEFLVEEEGWHTKEIDLIYEEYEVTEDDTILFEISVVEQAGYSMVTVLYGDEDYPSRYHIGPALGEARVQWVRTWDKDSDEPTEEWSKEYDHGDDVTIRTRVTAEQSDHISGAIMSLKSGITLEDGITMVEVGSGEDWVEFQYTLDTSEIGYGGRFIVHVVAVDMHGDTDAMFGETMINTVHFRVMEGS